MSLEAMTWAFKQDVPDPGAKLVLLALCDHVNPLGECWPSLNLLQAWSSQSRRTVIRKLDELVALGMIRIEPRHDRTGRQTSNRYILQWVGAAKVYAGPRVDEGEGVKLAPSPDGPLFEVEPQNAAREEGAKLAPGGATADTGEGANVGTPEGVTADTPRTLIGTPMGNPHAREPARDPQDDLFQEWWEAYPQQGHGFSKDRAKLAWRALSPDDRKLALRAAEHIGPKSRMGRGKPKDPYYWLHDRVFATIAEEHGWTNGAPPPTPRKVFVEEDTEQWEAWAKTRPGKPFPKSQAPGHRNMGWYFDSEWPPGHKNGGRRQDEALQS